MGAQKAIERIVSNKGVITLDRVDFGLIDSLQYYGLHTFTVKTKKFYPMLQFKFDTSKDYKVVVNVTSDENISLFVIEAMLDAIRKNLEGDIDVVYGHSINSEDSNILVDLFVYN